jgi:hypothetical protein
MAGGGPYGDGLFFFPIADIRLFPSPNFLKERGQIIQKRSSILAIKKNRPLFYAPAHHMLEKSNAI